LPDGIFSNQNFQFVQWNMYVGIFMDTGPTYFMAFLYILWPFSIFCGNLVYFGMLHREKSGIPGVRQSANKAQTFLAEIANIIYLLNLSN
jgi:hypothetical protein